MGGPITVLQTLTVDWSGRHHSLWPSQMGGSTCFLKARLQTETRVEIVTRLSGRGLTQKAQGKNALLTGSGYETLCWSIQQRQTCVQGGRDFEGPDVAGMGGGKKGVEMRRT